VSDVNAREPTTWTAGVSTALGSMALARVFAQPTTWTAGVSTALGREALARVFAPHLGDFAFPLQSHDFSRDASRASLKAIAPGSA